jgi:AraC family transcriptional regulator
MKMAPRIIELKPRKVIGISQEMSLVDNQTYELWKSFRVRSSEIKNRISEDFISLQLFTNGYFDVFNPTNRFVKWACVEVESIENLPHEMYSLTIPGGSYAVFEHKGSGSPQDIFQYIYGEWIPKSKYQLDDRPHFEVLGAKYKFNDPTSEEEIWIPIKTK